MPHPVIIAFGAFLLLAACLPPDPPATTLPAEDSCGASALQALVGAPVADQDFTGQGGAQRIMAEGSPMTMDYRADRLNVTYDARSRISRIWCG